MEMFGFRKKVIGIDLGTSNTRIILNEQIVVDEPTMVAVEIISGKLIAVGKRAMMMHGKNDERVKTIKPIKDGVIQDFKAAVMMIKEMLKMAGLRSSFLKPAYNMIIGIPCYISEIEEKAVRDLAKKAGAKEVKFIFKSMAATIGMGIDLTELKGKMIIDIGGGTCEIAVIALGSIIRSETLHIAGDEFRSDIKEYILKQHNLHIDESAAERLMTEIGAAIDEIDNSPPNLSVYGRDFLTGIPKQIEVNYKEIAHSIDISISRIEDSIMQMLESIPDELYADLLETGIYLTGGSSKLRGLNKRLELKTVLPVHLADDPFHSVANGISLVSRKKNV